MQSPDYINQTAVFGIRAGIFGFFSISLGTLFWICAIFSENMKHFITAFSDINPVIILISSWKNGFVSSGSKRNSPQVRKLEEKLDEAGMKIYGIIETKDRDDGIILFLQRHKGPYLILDDDISEYKKTPENLYIVNYKTGLTAKDVKEIKRIIKKVS